MATPILFVLGPSGAGKSTLGAWIRDDLGFLHLEIDRWDGGDGDGIDLEGLRDEWTAFWLGGNPQALAAAVRARAASASRRGAVLTFASPLVLSAGQITAAAAAGIRIIVLYGTARECLDAFLRRERESGRGLVAEYWMAYNRDSHARFSLPEYAPFRIAAFQDGRFRDRATLVAEVKSRFGAPR